MGNIKYEASTCKCNSCFDNLAKAVNDIEKKLEKAKEREAVLVAALESIENGTVYFGKPTRTPKTKAREALEKVRGEMK